MIGSIREALWQVLRIYDVGDKLLNGIKSIYVKSLACVRVKGCESECFRIHNGVRQVCIMSPWLLNVYIDTMIEFKVGIGKRGVCFQEEGRECSLPSLLYADDLAFGGDSEEDLRAGKSSDT